MRTVLIRGSLIVPVVFAAWIAYSVAQNVWGVCFIYNYNGAGSDYAISRQNANLNPAPLLPLQIGDRVSVLKTTDPNTGKPVTITLSVNGKLATVDAQHSPYCVGWLNGVCGGTRLTGGAMAPGSAVGNLLALVAPVFGKAQDDYYNAHSNSFVAMSAPVDSAPSVPILTSAPLCKAPASPSLALPWNGGTPPFVAALYAANQTNAIAQKTVSDSNVEFDSLNLKPGTYRFTVKDANGKTTTANFQVVDQTQVPALSKEAADALNDPVFTQQMRSMVVAGYIKLQGRQWYLAAYQQIKDVPSTDTSPAGKLRESLTQGV